MSAVNDLRPVATGELAREIGRDGVIRARAAGQLIKVKHGWNLDAACWADLDRTQRHLVCVRAAAGANRGAPAVFSHLSACALWGLPVYRADLSRVHVILDPAHRSRSTREVRRHFDELADGDTTTLGDLAVTSLDRTLIDVARAEGFETAMVAVEAAFARIGWGDRRVEYDREAVEHRRRSLLERIRGMPAVRGVRRASAVLASASGRSHSVGETLSRLRLEELGFQHIRQQVRIEHGVGWFDMDFGLDDIEAWGEFDGRIKYVDPSMRGGRTADEVVVSEKRREDIVRAVTGRRVLRWEWPEAVDARKLSRRLSFYGISVPRVPAGTRG